VLQLPGLRPEHDEHLRRSCRGDRGAPAAVAGERDLAEEVSGPSVPSSLPFDVTTALPSAITKKE
jgi:hypothetical protein